MPGFIENHIHMTNSPQRTWINIRPEMVGSIDDIKDSRIGEDKADTRGGVDSCLGLPS